MFTALSAAGLAVTYCVCMGTLILYFDLTVAWATTEAEVNTVVAGDGARLVFTGLFFGPTTSLLLALTGFAVHYARRVVVPSYPDWQRLGDDAIARTMPSPQTDDPYCPPVPNDGG
ncbi:hypothetical protein N9N28_18035 [Rubripirellula amarantea]|nr:hypothetical protein [Rubripirellula amarantea]